MLPVDIKFKTKKTLVFKSTFIFTRNIHACKEEKLFY